MAGKMLCTLALTGLALLGTTALAPARIHGQMYCWGFDLEFPVPCDYDGEAEEAAPNSQVAAVLRSGIPPMRPSPTPRAARRSESRG
jgi:hypothetical protein